MERHIYFLVTTVRFELTKLTHAILSRTPLTTRERCLLITHTGGRTQAKSLEGSRAIHYTIRAG